MKAENYILMKNAGEPVEMSRIPVLDYRDFSDGMIDLMGDPGNHCVLYYAFPFEGGLRFIACIARDLTGDVAVLSHHQHAGNGSVLDSLTPQIPQLHLFEREIRENFDVRFEGHPWLKPVRSGIQGSSRLYPFYRIDGGDLHEVGVGPIHAGVIEPGHFRFICNGEKVLHLEIQLGYQHRGIERLMAGSDRLSTSGIFAESIVGDTAVGHGLAHAQLMESLGNVLIPERLRIERSIALELERIAVHIGDTAALCADVAYQAGQVVNEALRTTIINTTQLWCGNRFGKGLIRPGGTHYPAGPEFLEAMMKVIDDSGSRFIDMADVIYTSPSVLSRFDGCGSVTRSQAELIGAVGMAARTCGVARDIRKTHPFAAYANSSFEPVTIESGDVLARGMLRNMEVRQSTGMIREWAKGFEACAGDISGPPSGVLIQAPSSFAISLVEGWRGEICHAAVTGADGRIIHYKIKDPSFHNWMALALAVRNQEISDFPVCNKSFNLSYCGHDL